MDMLKCTSIGMALTIIRLPECLILIQERENERFIGMSTVLVITFGVCLTETFFKIACIPED